MTDESNSKFFINWIIKNKLAIGKYPSNEEDLELIRKKGIKSILNLCTEEEAPIPNGLLENFEFFRYPLPDHKVQKKLEEFEILEVIEVVEKLLKNGPIFIHCYASVERSPFICIAWLVLKENIAFLNALDHVKQSHALSNPIKDHLNLLMNIKF